MRNVLNVWGGAALAAVVLLVALSMLPRRAPTARGDGAAGEEQRIPWTTGRVTGSPEPPPPYVAQRVFPHIQFKNPVDLTSAPGVSDRLFVVEQYGKLYSFRNDPSCDKADLFLDLTKGFAGREKLPDLKGVGATYGLAFHPKFPENHYCFVCYVLEHKTLGQNFPTATRVSRFTVKADADGVPACDPASEVVMLEWRGGGHNGGAVKFGPDGCLYASSGDSADPAPPDKYDTGQDISDLLAGIMRIDVDHADAGRTYGIPKDNPFVNTPGARPEVWAYGMRNPWRMSFDRQTGNLWVADVGWELWEMVDRVERGGNYGWSVNEGPQTVRPGARRGPTPILPPALSLSHAEAASITGGFVYRGKRLPELVGHYVFGDWETRRIWDAKVEGEHGEKLQPHRLTAFPGLRVVCFGEDPEGELYFMDYEAGQIHQLVPNPASGKNSDFPRRLSDTGLFASVADQKPAPGVYPFAPNASQWADGATAERFVAIPGEGRVTLGDENKKVWPKDSVLVRTFSIEAAPDKPETRRRVETQLLHFDGRGWNGYTYKWNEQATDAELVEAKGASATYTAPDGKGKTTWQFGSRAQCMACHNPWADFTLAFTQPQLDGSWAVASANNPVGATLVSPSVSRANDTRARQVSPLQTPSADRANDERATQVSPLHQTPSAHSGNQLARFKHLGLWPTESQRRGNQPAPAPLKPLVNPYDASADLEARARAYLQVNCAHCHRFGGGGSALIDLRYELTRKETKTVGVPPVVGDFGIPAARIIAPGDPGRSVMLFRTSKLGRGRMPHVGSNVVDERGVTMLAAWVNQLQSEPREGSIGPDAEHQRSEERDAVKALAAANAMTPEASKSLDRLLSTSSGALSLALALHENALPEAVRKEAVVRGAHSPQESVRDLFEAFLPPEQLAGRLGPAINSADILKLSGDAARGRAVFFGTGGTAGLCSQCHQVAGQGQTFAPDLSHVATKYPDRAVLLEQVLEPSKNVDPKFATTVVQTNQGDLRVGILIDRTDMEVVLKDAQAKEWRIPAADVKRLATQPGSIMPEGLLGNLTAQQAADLLAFLHAQK